MRKRAGSDFCSGKQAPHSPPGRNGERERALASPSCALRSVFRQPAASEPCGGGFVLELRLQGKGGTLFLKVRDGIGRSATGGFLSCASTRKEPCLVNGSASSWAWIHDGKTMRRRVMRGGKAGTRRGPEFVADSALRGYEYGMPRQRGTCCGGKGKPEAKFCGRSQSAGE